jgi:hypothetical protein
MNIGMLWHDNDPKTTLEQKIQKATAYYLEKYGKQANTVYVNPKTLNGAQPAIEGITLRTSSQVLQNHFWIGCEAA